MLEKIKCSHTNTVYDAMKIIKENTKRCVFVINEANKLVGILTDGDIRNFLMSDYNLSAKVSKIMNKNFAYAKINDTYSSMVKKINDKITILPIVDDDMRLIDLFELNTSISFPIAKPNIGDNELKYLIDAFLSTWISSSGEYIDKFEKQFCKYCNKKYGIATSNCTAALHLALLSLGITKGDEVIVPDLTFAATINAVLYVGATPVIVDVEKNSWCIDADEIEKAVTERTKAIIPVHLYGQPCDMDKILKIANDHNLYIIEDCAEAHGAKYKNKPMGSFGDISCFSFYGNKIITTGEGGMCVTDNEEIREKILELRDHGMKKDKRYWHNVLGYNYRMTNMQAALGLAQIERIEEILLGRKLLEEKYKKELKKFKFLKPQTNNFINREKVTWLVSYLVEERYIEKLIEELAKEKIYIRKFFYPLSSMPIYNKYTYSNSNSKEIAKKGINFPTTIDLTDEFFCRINNILERVQKMVEGNENKQNYI